MHTCARAAEAAGWHAAVLGNAKVCNFTGYLTSFPPPPFPLPPLLLQVARIMLDPWFSSQGARCSQERAKDCFKRVLLLVEGLPNKIYLFGQDWCRVRRPVAVQTRGCCRACGLDHACQLLSAAACLLHSQRHACHGSRVPLFRWLLHGGWLLAAWLAACRCWTAAWQVPLHSSGKA